MHDIIYTLFGEGKDLNALQMGCRTIVIFFIALALIRLSGMRSFGSKTAFDSIIVIMLGAILSRAVVGASPFLPTVVSGIVLTSIHRLLGFLSVKNSSISHIVKGEEISIYKDGKLHKKNMERCSVSIGDVMESVRQNGNIDDLEKVKEIFMERTGQLSIVKKEE